MKMRILGLLCAVVVLGQSGARSDEPLAKRMLEDGFSSVVMAKIAGTGADEHIAVSAAGWDVKYEEQVVTVTKLVSEVRTRTVKKGNQVVEEQFVVEVPVTEEQTLTNTILIPRAPQTGKLTLKDVKVWNLAGKQLTEREIRKALAKQVSLFSLSSAPEEGQPPVDPYFAQVLRPDLLIIYSEPLNEILMQSFSGMNEVLPAPAAVEGEAAPAPPADPSP